jgi:hypothetical protein
MWIFERKMCLYERKTYDHLHDPADSFMKGSTFTEECINDAKVWLNNWVHWNLQSVSPSQCSWDCWWHSHPSASHCKQPQMVRIFKSLAHNPEPPGREKQMHHQTESILPRLVTWKFDGVYITETGWHGHWIITILQPQRWIWNDRMEEETISAHSVYRGRQQRQWNAGRLGVTKSSKLRDIKRRITERDGRKNVQMHMNTDDIGSHPATLH